MGMSKGHDPGTIARQFQVDGNLVSVTPYGTGHINYTYCAVFRTADSETRVILQHINENIFKNPPAMMENIQRVSAHLSSKAASDEDRARRVLSVVPACDGRAWHRDDEGNYWRMYRFIGNARTVDAIESAEQAFQAARAFGRFQHLLADLPSPRLHDTIPDFHHTPKRLKALEEAIEQDAAGRVAASRPEIEFVMARREIAGALLGAGLPERVTHNDTKINNVMLDDQTGEGICVIDLDTVMPGLSLYDFGDMVRTATSPAAEDERNLSKVNLQFPMFEALVRGYLDAAGGFLTKEEKRLLVTAGKVITFEQAVRFLADHLNGDTYYKVHREGHNLDRTRTQLKLIERIEAQEERMERLVESMG